MGKKDILAATLYKSGFLALKKYMCRTNRLHILAYHRIANYGLDYQFDEHLISATPEEFEWQISYLKSNYNIVSFKDVIQTLAKHGELPQRAVIVTFDDGFYDNYEIAYPLLIKYKVPATFFITTGYINKRHLFWFDQCAYICKKISTKLVLYGAKHNKLYTIDNRITKCGDPAYQLLKIMKQISNIDRLSVIDQLNKYMVNNNLVIDSDDQLNLPMSWENIIEMHKSGQIEIGSHTVSHPILSRLSNEEITYELSHSKLEIEDHLGAVCTTLAYPVGGEDDINDFVIQEAERLGYKMASSYIKGGNNLNYDSNFYKLNRIHIEKETTRARFCSMLEFPHLFG